jgi:hypothetical protein
MWQAEQTLKIDTIGQVNKTEQLLWVKVKGLEQLLGVKAIAPKSVNKVLLLL